MVTPTPPVTRTPPSTRTTLILDAEVDGRRVDVRLGAGVILAVGASLDRHGVDHLLDAEGGALLPGLHDHHVHLAAMAARLATIDLDACASAAEVDARLVAACVLAGGGWVRVGGYDEHRHGPLDAARLDALTGSTPMRVQHRTGLSWVLNSAALARLDLDDAPPAMVERDGQRRPTGWLHRSDEWLRPRIERTPLALDQVGAQLAALGITGVTDATADLGADRLALLREAHLDGSLPQHLLLLGVENSAEVHAETGEWAMVGPRKLLVDETRGIELDDLVDRIRGSHERGRAVALHAVTRTENVAAVSALLAAGAIAGDRIEHASVMPIELDQAVADAGITLVLQPALVGERGDHHLGAVDADDLPLLHRQTSLLAAGVRVAAGSDAPVTSVDPWRAIATAADRHTRSGAVVGASERVDPAIALGWFLTPLADPGGPPRRVEVGESADLCLLDAPLATMLAAPDASHVRATWIDAQMVHP